MPKYDFKCKSCEEVIEVTKGMSEPGPEKCEDCGGDMQQVFFPAPVTFKGSGFYRTGG